MSSEDTEKKPIKAHFIPKFLQKNFVAKDRMFCLYNKSTGEFHPSCPAEAFTEDDFYEDRVLPLKGEDKSRASTEDLLSILESQASEIINKILKAHRSKKEICLNSDERQIVNKFTVIEGLRHKEAQEILKPNDPITLAMRVSKHDQLVSNAFRAEAMGDLICNWDEIAPFSKMNVGITIKHIGNCERGFIIGMAPIPENPAEMSYPVSSQIALTANVFGQEEVLELNQEEIDLINLQTYKNSTEVVAKDKAWIEAIVAQANKGK